MADAPDRVRAAAQHLDAVNPSWFDRIRTHYLNFQSCTDCILGQLYGGYRTGLGVLGLTQEMAIKYGFAAKSVKNWRTFEAEIQELERLWKGQVAQRKRRKYEAA